MVFAQVDKYQSLIDNAHQKHGRDDPCWCLSGKKYKNCHLDRESKTKVTYGQALQVNNQLFTQKRCMHNSKCSGKRIKAHTIQRNGGLSHIIDGKNHVLMMNKDINGHEPKEIGWKEASTFYGFCENHDSEIFKEIETNNFSATLEQCFLFYYRALCYELYQKESLVEILKKQRETIDYGLDLNGQIQRQLGLLHNIDMFNRTVEELQEEKKEADDALQCNTYSNFSHLVIYFSGTLDLFTTSHFHVSYDLHGNQIYDINNQNIFGEGASFSIMSISDNSGALIISWNKKYLHVFTFINHFLKIDKKFQLNLIHQLLFSQSENICFSSNWWSKLNEEKKSFVKKLSSFMDDNYGNELRGDVILHRWNLEKIDKVNF